MASPTKKVIGLLAIAMLLAMSLAGVGCGNGDDGSERAVEWRIDPPVGTNWVRLSATIGVCHLDSPLLERPIIEHEGSRVYIELRRTPEELSEDVNGCFLELIGAFKKSHL